jgi:hypothetical protein
LALKQAARNSSGNIPQEPADNQQGTYWSIHEEVAVRSSFGNGLPSAVTLSVLLGLSTTASGSSPDVVQDSSQDSFGVVSGPASDSVQALFPHARGVFLAEVASVEHSGRPGSDLGMSEGIRLRVISSTGVAPDGLWWVVALGNIPLKNHERVWRYYNPPERKLRITSQDFTVGRRYWFVTADPSERNFYPQGIMRYWPADSTVVPATIPRAVKTDAYRVSPK